MSNIEILAFEKAEGWFRGETNNEYHNNPDAKRNAALKLATPAESGKLNLAQDTLRNRNYFLAHWGEADNESISRYAYLTLLTMRVKEALGQPIMVLHQGTFDDIPRQDEFSYETVKFRTGIISTDAIEHGVAFNNGTKGLRRQGVKPPYLSYGLHVVVNNLHTVEVDFLDSSCNVTMSKDEEALIPVYLGTVSLVDDLMQYHKTKNLVERPYVTGEQACLDEFKAIDLATSQTLSLHSDIMYPDST